MHIDQDFFRVIAVQEPIIQNDTLITLLLTLENMKGEQKTKNITFNSLSRAYEFYNIQSKILANRKKR